MIVRLVLWNVADTVAGVDELRDAVRAHVEADEERPDGLLVKLWISDDVTERFGAIELWASREAAEGHGYERERELIGKDPEIGEELAVEAWDGSLAAARILAGRGRVSTP